MGEWNKKYETNWGRLLKARKLLGMAIKSGTLCDRYPEFDASSKVKVALFLVQESVELQKQLKESWEKS